MTRQRIVRAAICAALVVTGERVSLAAPSNSEPLAPAAAGAADEASLSDERWIAQVRSSASAKAAALLIDGRTDDLDRLVQESAAGTGRDASGRWIRSQIYAGIASAFPDQADHPLWATLDRVTLGWMVRRAGSHAAALARAQYWIARAWLARGDGYPDAPSLEQMQAFETDLRQANGVLDAHERVSPSVVADEPHWAVVRIKVANLVGDDKSAIHQLAITALQRHPDYDPIAAEAALALNPVWGGKSAEAKAFVDEAVTIARPVSGEQMRARIAIHLARNAGMDPALLLVGAGFTWETLKPGLDELVATYPDPYSLNAARLLACISLDPARARPYFERLQGRIQSIAWYDNPWSVGDCATKAGVALVGHAPWAEGYEGPTAAAPQARLLALISPTVGLVSAGVFGAALILMRRKRARSSRASAR